MVDIEVYDDKRHCYGCSACRNSCPLNAILMQEDEEGFLYPVINQELCSSCGRCRSVCPIYHSHTGAGTFKQKVYAVSHQDDKVRAASTSGGVFTALSDFILDKGGVVYGAVLDETLKVCHVRAESREMRDRIRGSKYVQSDMKDLFRLIQADLSLGKPVLFTGTPCQNAGLAGYLRGTDTADLMLCDIVCHGVPSPLLWKEYTYYVKEKSKVNIKAHSFRIKTKGWHAMCSCNEYENGKKDCRSVLSQVHLNLFLSNLVLRPSCYQCGFSSFQRCSDITIADFWGIERTQPEFDDNKGVSLVLINTEKGKLFFGNLEGRLNIRESTAAACLQHNLEAPTPLPPYREAFWRDYHSHGYSYIAEKYGGNTRSMHFRNFLHNRKNMLAGLFKQKP